MDRWKTIWINLLFCLALMCSFHSFSQELVTSSRYAITNVSTNDLLSVYDPLFQEESLQPSLYKTDRRFRVELHYTRSNHTDVLNGLQWRLSVELEHQQTNATQVLVIENTSIAPGVYGAWSDFASDNDFSEWKILNVSAEKYTSGSWGAALLSELPQGEIYLECMVFNDRIVALDNSGCPTLGLNTTTQELSWDYVRGAIEYDVEWVHIDERDNFTLSSQESPFEFKEPVRITTYKHSHRLDLIYPKGTVYFRVRPKGYFFSTVNDQEVYYSGDWCYTAKAGETDIPYQVTEHHEGLKNWAYSVAFAENGMSSSSISYMDGTLRARQSLTKANSTQQVLAASSLYDYEGRQTVQVMPTPISGGSLNYFENLHTDTQGNTFDKDDFDLGVSNPLGTTSGAGQYFSPNNDFTTSEEPFRERIPNAEGYVYSQTRFIRDNTGRPRVSAGVGQEFAMGSGHESYFYYVKPTERDLRELFGSNVGKVEHYDKQITVDPNGQAYVSYTDMLGRTIASGLYGEAPESLMALDNNPSGNPVQVKANLMPGNLLTTDASGNLQSVTDYYHMNVGANDIILDYNLASGVINKGVNLFGSSCASCYYELEIHVYDPTGQEVDLNYTSQSQSATFSYVYEKYSESQLDCNLDTYVPSSANISKTLNISMTGEYRIVKILKVDENAVDAYLLNELGNLSTMPSLSNITNTYMSNIVTTGCGFDCDAFFTQECRESLGFPISGNLTPSQQAAVDACILQRCVPVDPEVLNDQNTSGDLCAMMLETFKNDIRPGIGWVFENDLDWRANTAKWDLDYPLAAGGVFNPTSLQDLEDNWEEGWEDVLVVNHPEYCHYTKCVAIDALKDEEFAFYQVETMADAITQGFVVNTISYDIQNHGDPLFTHALYSSTAGTWLNGLNAAYQGTSGNMYDYITGTLLVNHPNLAYDDQGVSLTGVALENRIWELMRSLYLGERSSFIEENYTPNCPYYDHSEANLIDPEVIESTSSMQNQIAPANASCPDVCQMNVALWMDRIQEECDNLSTAQLHTISNSLQDYCLSDCDGLFNTTGAIQLSDLLSNPMNADLQSVETILTANCGFSLNALAWNDTCSNASLSTVNAHVYSPVTQENLSMFLTLKHDGYALYSTSPAVVNQSAQTLESYWDTDAKVKITNTGTLTNTEFFIKDISSIEIINSEIDVNTGTVLHDVRVVKLNGSEFLLTMDKFSVKVSDTKWVLFDVNVVLLNVALSGEVCDDISNPFDVSFDLQSWIDDCIDDIEYEATVLAAQEYLALLDDLRASILASFSANCFGDGLDEKFTITYSKQEYGFTLYYYDQAGNLVQTVPPQGCKIVPGGHFPGGVWDGTEPVHKMKTMYTYNSLGQMVKSQTPDGGTANFYYNSIQQLRFSQNDHQAATNSYSYTRYDELGRPVEAGETDITVFAPYFEANKDNNAFPQSSSSNPNREVVRTYYEEQPLALDPLLGWAPKDLNTRVGAVAKYDVYQGDQNNYSSAIFYDYDIHGNVQKVLNDNPAIGNDQRYKQVRYEYELYSGKMLKVIYQEHEQDQFIHQYEYDDDNRLLSVQTSRNGVDWDTDAEYFYYLTGALARMELGDDKVQGMDYLYNLNGWLKGINSNTLEARRDMGHDGAAINDNNKWVAQDAIGFSLTYYDGDYAGIVPEPADNAWFATNESTFMPSTGADLYNGNIRSMITAVRKDDNNVLDVLAKVYQYDQWQRIKEAKTFTSSNLVSSNSWAGGSFTDAYYSSYSFDLNGNLTELTRNGSGAENYSGEYVMDKFTYYYDDGSGGLISSPTEVNRLLSVVDAIDEESSGSVSSGKELYAADINSTQSSSSANYAYDKIGRLISDVDEGITKITWTVFNKVAYIKKSGSNADIGFQYDPMGIRIAKVKYPKDAGGSIITSQIEKTFYVRDAQGNLMATYSQIGASPTSTDLVDHDLYGSSRLGVQNINETLSTSHAFDFCATDNRASAIIEITSSTFNSGQTVEYRVGMQSLHSPLTWGNVSLETNVANLLNALNKNTAKSDIAAELWYSHNTSNTYYIELKYGQPGNWKGQELDVYVNSTLSNASQHLLKRELGLGVCTGSDVLGNKRFELSNHLGNVLAVISDRKWSVDGGEFNSTTGALITATPDGQVDYYQAEIVAYNDYYPYGMLMDGRHGSAGGQYRYGFQGQEMDDEIKGKGNSVNYKYRMHDPRIGRFFARDPLAGRYPHYSPYQFSGNKVIHRIELEGLEEAPVPLSQQLATPSPVLELIGANNSTNSANSSSVDEETAKVFWAALGQEPTNFVKPFETHSDPISPLDDDAFGGISVISCHDGTLPNILPISPGSRFVGRMFPNESTAHNLAFHYGQGMGRDYNLSFDEAIEVFPEWMAINGETQGKLNLTIPDYTMSTPTDGYVSSEIPVYAGADVTVGGFTMWVEGSIAPEEMTFPGQSLTDPPVTRTVNVFRGVAKMKDYYNYDVNLSKRGWWANAKVAGAALLMASGEPFWVYGEVPIYQVQGDVMRFVHNDQPAVGTYKASNVFFEIEQETTPND